MPYEIEGLGTTIATTDSAAVLYQIRNMLHRPATMQHCKNKALIEQIVHFIGASPHHIHLQKVKAQAMNDSASVHLPCPSHSAAGRVSRTAPLPCETAGALRF
jgi:hypothetical protein